MCGIAGIINFNKEPVNEKVLWAMTDSLAHRGPNGRGIYLDRYLGLGHRRLAIIDLSARAHQPMRTEDDRYAISYNGEVYNFPQIRRQLQGEGVSFRSESDAEVVLKAYAAWGEEVVSRFNGMFACGIWDARAETLTLIRDRYGIKPLYYWQKGSLFLFASEIKAFFHHPAFHADLDPETLLEYFTFQNTFTFKTLFRNVKLLPPAHIMRVSLKDGIKISTRQFWDFHFREDTTVKSEDEYLEELDRLFEQAVKRQLVSDVEIGSFLSGGTDTGSVVAVASQEFKDLKTFCVGFDLSSASGLEISCDERARAEHISYLYQTEHYEMVLKSGDMMRCLPQLVGSLEDLRLGQSYPNFYASKLASRFVKVCLAGAGGDELFAGYPWRYYKRLKSKNFDDYIDGYYKYWQRLVPNKILQKLFSPIEDKVGHVWTEDIFKDVFSMHKLTPKNPEDYINHSLYFEAKTFLHGLLLVDDKLSMANGLETRVPMLDNDLVDFALKVPVRMKLKDIDHILSIDEDELAKQKKYFEKMRDGKLILRNVLGKYVGDDIANGHKQGFSGPDASWFKGESIEFVKRMLLDKGAGIYHYFDYATARRLIEDHLEGRQNRRLFIWSLLCFEWWVKIFLQGAGRIEEKYAQKSTHI
ncbi:MAG: asparagine synthase (glutamine-hydrolyzing), partial [Candidatus Omnitrophica bacterium]|nr:asparagine synthase (glutamine-hydrolyzing) [Candidatus Omnitrophota bacterium]